MHQDEQTDAGIRMRAVEMAFEPVIGRSAAIGLEQLRIAGGVPIELGAFEQHAAQPEQHRTVWIARLVSVRMVRAMHGHPFARDRARAEPQPEAKHVSQQRMQDEAAV